MVKITLVSTYHDMWPPKMGYKLKNGLRLKKILFKTEKKYHDHNGNVTKEIDGLFA